MTTTLRYLCCCCASGSEEESTPFAREGRSQKAIKTLNKGEKLVMKHVNVPSIDNQFAEIGNLYNDQVEHHETMTQCISSLAHISHSSPDLTACIQRLKDNYYDYDIKVLMEGYNFSLLVKTEKEPPENLKQAQEIVKKLSRASKLLISNQTRLGEMMFTVLQSQNKTDMESSIKEANTVYMDQLRLKKNLEDNLQKTDKARQLSKEYEEDANKILIELSKISGAAL
ncbi:hypothetical protein XENTR_v10004048 [Xenopus tropicalis]|uniref:Uncharacterized protein LOC100496220 n=1 Tax=Xenopus tropicalis TaxID=8364 RepID=A0A8J0SJM4_XENTR|nr:uncharacterized protein LOC100496220 [Xenopus tropicalis]KAE8576074.1 hypothetical protein XENTR_v10004048 [Xenopus tropicalis]KAE8576075.1 hypothetical protein XENTR_v10004048 [Xenopus tropicalis]